MRGRDYRPSSPKYGPFFCTLYKLARYTILVLSLLNRLGAKFGNCEHASLKSYQPCSNIMNYSITYPQTLFYVAYITVCAYMA